MTLKAVLFREAGLKLHLDNCSVPTGVINPSCAQDWRRGKKSTNSTPNFTNCVQVGLI